MFTVIYAMVMAAGQDHDVPAGSVVYHRGARMFANYVLRTRRTAWANAVND